VRYPRGTGPGVAVEKTMEALPVGKAEIRRKGKHIAILAFGTVLAPCLEAGKELDATVVNMRFVKPIDEELILEMARAHDLLVTVEENVVQGGAGSAVNEVLAKHAVAQLAANYGLPDRLIQHGSQDDMLKDAGLTGEGILAFIQEQMQVAGLATSAKSA
jgi:1-deoxy-D-xylulose-5-phosphate synthase